MILCVGEILADMIGTEKDGSFYYERKAGGAPFNVACAAAKFGADTAFIGSVGDDLIGDFLIGFAKDNSKAKTYIQKTPDYNTTLAFVELSGNGERNFCFYRKNTADYRLPKIPADVWKEADIVHVGSLMLSEKEGLAYALDLAKKAKEEGKTVSFDVNFRSDIFRDTPSAVREYKKVIALADIVKFSEDETGIFGADYIKNDLGEKLVCISLGGKGSMWRYRGNSEKVPSIAVKPIDTTGAGDAFYGGVLSVLERSGGKARDEKTLNEALKFGNVCGALNTLTRGAIDGLPDLKTVESYL